MKHAPQVVAEHNVKEILAKVLQRKKVASTLVIFSFLILYNFFRIFIHQVPDFGGGEWCLLPGECCAVEITGPMILSQGVVNKFNCL